MTTDLIGDLPELRDIERRRRALDDAQAKWQARKRDAGERFAADVEDRNRRVRAALLAGEEPPPPVDESAYVVEGNLSTFFDQRDALKDEERAVIAAHAPTLRARIDREESALLARLSPHVQAIARITGEVNELRRMADAVDRAEAGSSRTVKPRGDLQPHEVADWAAEGGDLLTEVAERDISASDELLGRH